MDEYHVPGSNHAYYIPNFVTEEEETYLMRKRDASPEVEESRQQTACSDVLNYPLHVRTIRQTPGGELTQSNVLVAQKLPPYVTDYPNLIKRIRDTMVFANSKHAEPNHLLLNEYLPGQGIMPHEDGASYYPTVATLSLNSHTVFHYYRYSDSSNTSEEVSARPIDRTPFMSLLLEPRSLVITTSELYTDCLHGIDGIATDSFLPDDERIVNRNMLSQGQYKSVLKEGGDLERRMRVSLTFRDVEKVLRTRLP